MKSISILLLLFSINVAAQRVEFKDPDLTFSFVKPIGWTVNDGPTIFVYPEKKSTDQPITFFSITYFEGPEQPEGSDFPIGETPIEPSIPANLKDFKADEVGRIYIADEVALWASYFHMKNGIRIKAISYVFKKMNQRFEISISAPNEEFKNFDITFKDILSSLSIDKN